MSTPRAARPRLAVAVLTAVAAAAYITYGLVQYTTFRVGTFDLVIFDEAVRSYAHLHPGVSPAKGVQDGFGPGFSVLGDHWSPVIALLAPLYWVYNGPQDLVVAQGVLFALAVPPLWLFTRRICAVRRPGSRGPVVAAYLAAAAYAVSWPIAAAVATGFHEVAFVPVLTAVFFERLAAGQIRTALAAAFALLLVKEDMGLLVAGFGLFLLAARGTRFSRWAPGPPAGRPPPGHPGRGLVAGGIAAMVLATYVLRPAFGGRAGYYWAYWSLGGNARLAAEHALRDPLMAARLGHHPVGQADHDDVAGWGAAVPAAAVADHAGRAAAARRADAGLAQPNWWGTTIPVQRVRRDRAGVRRGGRRGADRRLGGARPRGRSATGRSSSPGWSAPRPCSPCPGSRWPAWPPPGSTAVTARCRRKRPRTPSYRAG